MNTSTPNIPPIDFSRYPLEAGNPVAMASVIQSCRAQLDKQQYCSLPGFIMDEAISTLIVETEALLDKANRADSWRNCYLQRNQSPQFPAEHPRNIFNHASYRMIPADLLHPDSALKQLYNWLPFQRMVAEIVGIDELFPSEDRLQPVNVICYGDGDQSAWHYDSSNAFTMTLMLQAAEEGGVFELAANTRKGEEDEDIDYMKAVLSNRSARIKAVSRHPGELTIFRGCNSLHRVTLTRGDKLRLMAVFVYEEVPGVTGDPEVNKTVYGRTGLEN